VLKRCLFVLSCIAIIKQKVTSVRPGKWECLCCAHSLSEDDAAALGAQAGEARLASVFTKAGFGEFRKAKATPFNLILEAKV
jgi:hypothetical protein